MEPVGTHGLSCIGDEDFAALALYMQCLGEGIDDALGAQQTSLQSFMDQPTIIVTSTADRTIPLATPTISDLFNIELFNNTNFMSLAFASAPGVNSIQIGSAPGSPVTVPYPRGVYVIGGTTTMDAVGAVTVMSSRGLNITVDDPTAPPPGFNSPSVTDQTYDPSVFPFTVAQNVKFEVVLDGISGVNVTFSSFHTNVASDVAVLAFAFAYVTYIGPRDIVEVT